jgi:hypothetical protein
MKAIDAGSLHTLYTILRARLKPILIFLSFSRSGVSYRGPGSALGLVESVYFIQAQHILWKEQFVEQACSQMNSLWCLASRRRVASD